MRILALEKECAGATPAAFEPHLRAEAAHLWAQVQAGRVRETWFRDDRPEAVLLLECDGLDEARALLAAFPLVRAGLIEFDLVPLRAYPGFARLFS